MSDSRIFANTAPHYWAVEMPVIPLRVRQKRPVSSGWSAYANSLPEPSVQSNWLEAYPNNNIGLVLGPQSRVLVIDIDSEAPRVITAILEVLAPFQSPWKRVGKKGMALAFRWNAIETFRIKGPDNKTLVELLSTGTQVALPPSIHPDTGRPYTANAKLFEVIGSLTELPRDIEKRLRAELLEIGALSTSQSQFGMELNEPHQLGEILADAKSDSGKIEDGRNGIGTRIRAGVFARLKEDGRLSLETFSKESWDAFSQVCATEPTSKSPNAYTVEAWTKICQGDYRRLSKKQAAKGKLIPDIPPHWSGEIVSLEEGTNRLDTAISAFFEGVK